MPRHLDRRVSHLPFQQAHVAPEPTPRRAVAPARSCVSCTHHHPTNTTSTWSFRVPFGTRPRILSLQAPRTIAQPCNTGGSRIIVMLVIAACACVGGVCSCCARLSSRPRVCSSHSAHLRDEPRLVPRLSCCYSFVTQHSRYSRWLLLLLQVPRPGGGKLITPAEQAEFSSYRLGSPTRETVLLSCSDLQARDLQARDHELTKVAEARRPDLGRATRLRRRPDSPQRQKFHKTTWNGHDGVPKDQGRSSDADVDGYQPVA